MWILRNTTGFEWNNCSATYSLDSPNTWPLTSPRRAERFIIKPNITSTCEKTMAIVTVAKHGKVFSLALRVREDNLICKHRFIPVEFDYCYYHTFVKDIDIYYTHRSKRDLLFFSRKQLHRIFLNIFYFIWTLTFFMESLKFINFVI